MKVIATICLAVIILTLVPSCKKIDHSCMKGTVIGSIRSQGGGPAVSLDKKYKGTVQWQDHKNVIELLNIPEEYITPGTTFYFTSREPSSSEMSYVISADGDERIKLVLYGEKFSTTECP